MKNMVKIVYDDDLTNPKKGDIIIKLSGESEYRKRANRKIWTQGKDVLQSRWSLRKEFERISKKVLDKRKTV